METSNGLASLQMPSTPPDDFFMAALNIREYVFNANEQSLASNSEGFQLKTGRLFKDGILQSGLHKKEGVIKDFVPGEAFTIFNPTVLAMLEAVPALRGDPDLANTNEGVTVLWLK